LQAVVTVKRDKGVALKLLKRIMKTYGRPQKIATDGLRAYSAAMKDIGNADRQEAGRGLNNRAESSHQPFRRRERAMQRFRNVKTLQKFSSRSGPQPFQSGAPSRHPPSVQRRDALPHWPSGAPSQPNGRLGLGELRHALPTCRYSDETHSRQAGGDAGKSDGAAHAAEQCR